MQLSIPTLQTERLALIPPDPSHLDAYLATYGDPAVVEHFTEPMDKAKVWQMMANQIGHWVLRGFGGWSVQVRETGAIIGRLGLMQPEGTEVVEIGWVLGRESWGKGYATEGARVALAFGFESLGLARINARIRLANTGSMAVAGKLGMVIDPELSTDERGIFYALRAAQ
jgi:RimJ/RimL family protein N-acetyltransferase